MINLATQKNETEAQWHCSLSHIHTLLYTLIYSLTYRARACKQTQPHTHTNCVWYGQPGGEQPWSQLLFLWPGQGGCSEQDPVPCPAGKSSEKHWPRRKRLWNWTPLPLCQSDLQLAVLRLQVCVGGTRVRGLFIICAIDTGRLGRRWGFTHRLLAKVHQLLCRCTALQWRQVRRAESLCTSWRGQRPGLWCFTHTSLVNLTSLDAWSP